VGPPFEMMPMVKETVIPYLQKKTSVEFISKEYIVMGNGESFFEERLAPFYQEFSELSLAPYASLGKIRYQLIGLEKNRELMAKADSQFRDLMADYIISDQSEEIEETLVHLLESKHYTIAFGESCTGGMLASKIINVPNASKVIHESLVTYSDESKARYLGVNPKTLQEFGAVSAETVSEMAEGLFKSTKADVCVTVSGIAGPSGGSDRKPVGLVHYAIKLGPKLVLENKIFQGSRDLVRMKATMWILYRVFKLIQNDQ
jgi:nicotinamide-nucleotide amidase